jgi:hypothetical protein
MSNDLLTMMVGSIEDDIHQHDRPDDHSIDHVREDQTKGGQQDGKTWLVRVILVYTEWIKR